MSVGFFFPHSLKLNSSTFTILTWILQNHLCHLCCSTTPTTTINQSPSLTALFALLFHLSFSSFCHMNVNRSTVHQTSTGKQLQEQNNHCSFTAPIMCPILWDPFRRCMLGRTCYTPAPNNATPSLTREGRYVSQLLLLRTKEILPYCEDYFILSIQLWKTEISEIQDSGFKKPY